MSAAEALLQLRVADELVAFRAQLRELAQRPLPPAGVMQADVERLVDEVAASLRELIRAVDAKPFPEIPPAGLADGDSYSVAAGTNSLVEVLGTASVSGNNSAAFQAVVRNTSSVGNTTVTVEFRSEVAASAVTAQIGASAAAVIG